MTTDRTIGGEMDEKTRSILKDVFGEATTQQVLTTPTEMDGKRAEVLIEAMPIDLLLRDLGIVAARQVAEVISMAGLRPTPWRPWSWVMTVSSVLSLPSSQPEVDE